MRRSGRQVLLLAEDFPSNVYTWRAFAAEKGCGILTVTRPAGGTWTDAVLASLDERVAIVAVPNVQWTDGALLDLVRIGARAREIGAALVVDASQSFGMMPLDLAAIRPDFLVAVGYKWLLGPYGLSYLYVDEKHWEGVPLEQNWLSRAGSEDFSSLIDYRDDYRPGARRFDMGERSALEMNNAGVASLRLLNEWGVANIAERLAAQDGADRNGSEVAWPHASHRRRHAARICSASSFRAKRRCVPFRPCASEACMSPFAAMRSGSQPMSTTMMRTSTASSGRSPRSEAAATIWFRVEASGAALVNLGHQLRNDSLLLRGERLLDPAFVLQDRRLGLGKNVASGFGEGRGRHAARRPPPNRGARANRVRTAFPPFPTWWRA